MRVTLKHLSPLTRGGPSVAALAALGLLAAGPVAAQDLTYTLSGITFNDGAVASGFFDFNPTTQAFGSYDIITTNGVTDSVEGGTYAIGTGYLYQLNSTTFDFAQASTNPDGPFHFLVIDFLSPVAAPGTYSLLPGLIFNPDSFGGSGEIVSSSPGVTSGVRAITAGSLIVADAAPVPEASTTVSFGLLLALGLGGRVIAAKRKKTNVEKAGATV